MWNLKIQKYLGNTHKNNKVFLEVDIFCPIFHLMIFFFIREDAHKKKDLFLVTENIIFSNLKDGAKTVLDPTLITFIGYTLLFK